MVRSLWLILAILAIAHVLAIGGFVGWLVATDRLDRDRVEKVRAILAQTITQEKSAEDAAQKARVEAERAATEGALPEHGARTAAEMAALKLEVSEVDRQKIAEVKSQIDALRLAMQNERSQLDRERAAFEAERSAFEGMRQRLTEIEGATQFRKAVATLEGMKAEDARTTMAELVQRGEKEQVVAYLDAMDERLRTRVLTEFITRGDAPLAAELLERIRTKGLTAPEPETLANAGS